MTFLLNSSVRVINANLHSYAKVGVVRKTGYRKTSVEFANGSVIEFLNRNLEYCSLPKPGTVVKTATDFLVGDLVENRRGQEARVIKVHDQPSGQYLNVELLGKRYPQVESWRAEGIQLIHRTATEEISSPRKFKETVGKFILWSPQSDKPPKVMHTTLSQAHEAQKSMAERYPQQEFYIMKAVSKMRMERKVELVPVVEQY